MAPSSQSHLDLKATLVRPDGVIPAHKSIKVGRQGNHGLRESDASGGAYLNISFRRTVRVPDNDQDYELPPDLGSFPIYNVQDYASKLPASVVKKGGVFIPIYRE